VLKAELKNVSVDSCIPDITRLFELSKMAHSHSTQELRNVCLVSNNHYFYTKPQAYKLAYTLMYIMYIFFIFFLVVITTRSAGTFKLGLHGNMEGVLAPIT
jgi:hypothetical protein